MHSTVAAEIWDELRRFVGGADRAEAADVLVSVLINNASVFADDRLGTITGESWGEHIDTNLRAPVLLAQCWAMLA